MTRKRFRRKQPWPNRCNIPAFGCRNWGIPRKTSVRIACVPGRDSTRGPHEYKSTALALSQFIEYPMFLALGVKQILHLNACQTSVSWASLKWHYRLVLFLQFDSKVMWCGRRSLQLTGTHYERMKWRVLMSSIGDVVAESVNDFRSLWNWQLYWISQSHFI